MRWRGRQKSQNVNDMRGRSGGGRRPRMNLGRGMRVGGRGGLLGLVVVAVIYFMNGGDVQGLLQQLGSGNMGGGITTNGGGILPGGSSNGGGFPNMNPKRTAREDELVDFVSVVLKDTEDAWDVVFREELGSRYRKPTLNVFSGSVNSACGMASSATGPFYCPGDEDLYIDLSFCDDLEKMGADGDFALAYVIAHEVGHHVQAILGTLDEVRLQKRRLGKADQNALQVKVELQADYFAGVWAHHAQKMKDILEKGDMEEALSAANAVGDDRLQKNARGYVVPESFTHGTSAQRMRWFKRGYQMGTIKDGDTFRASRL